MTLKVRKVKGINPKTKQEGIVARVVSNGKASFEDICELAGINTTMNVAELEAAGKLILQDHLKHCIVDAAMEGAQKAIDDLCEAIDKYMK